MSYENEGAIVESVYGGLSEHQHHQKPTVEKILQWYHEKNYDNLAMFCSMDEPLDPQGNTLMHYMARDLNQEAIMQIMRRDPRLISYNTVNKSNNPYDRMMPIHMALDTLIEKDIDDHSFIDFMVQQLMAATNIADGKNRIIKLQEEDQMIYPFNNEETEQKVKDIYARNDDILQCINKIAKREEKIRKEICDNKTSEYSELETQRETETTNCEDDVLSILSLPFRRMSKDQDIRNVLEVLEYHEAEKSKLSSQVGGKETKKPKKKTVKKAAKKTTASKSRARVSDSEEEENDEWYTNKIQESGKNDSFVTKNRETLMRQINADSESESDPDTESESDPETESDSNSGRARHISEEEQKKRDEHNETYRKFAQTIMDKMSVDEDTAKVYRAYVKYKVIEQNKGKELFKRSNEGERLKKMDEIISNTTKLKKLLENLDVDAIKKILNEDRDKRLQDSEKNKSGPKKTTAKSSTDSDSSETSEAPKPKKKAPVKAEAKGKKKTQEGSARQNKNRKPSLGKYKINSEGYIHSDEVIISHSDS